MSFRMAPKIDSPTKQQMALLEPFSLLPLEKILVVSTKGELDAAFSEISAASQVGFDTESKPLFTKGEISEGPHVVQFATAEKAFIFQLHRTENRSVVASLLE